MPSERFLLPKDRADYALLKSIALDKNYIDVTDDSLARVATEWYDVHGRPERQLRAWYYLGRVQQNAGNPSGAIVSFQRAKQLAETCGDLFNEGMACRAMGYVYRNAYFNDEALSNMRHAYDCFVASEHTVHANYALLDVAEMLCSGNRFEESKATLKKLNSRLTSSDRTLSRLSNIVFSTCCYKEGMYDETIYLLKKAEQTSPSGLVSNALATLAGAYAMVGKRDSADYYLQVAFIKAKTSADLVSAQFIRYRIEEMKGDYRAAMQDASAVMFSQDSVFRTVLNQSVVAAQRDAYAKSYQLSESKVRNRGKQIVIISVLLASLLIVFLLLERNHKVEKEKMRLQIKNLSFDLQAMAESDSEKDNRIVELIQEKIGLINEATDAWLDSTSGEAVSMAQKLVETKLLALKNDESFFIEMEEIVNSSSQQVMSLLRSEVALTSHQYHLMCCFYAGLSTDTIHILTGESRSNIYSIKSRIKERIRRDNPPHKFLFLSDMRS